MVAVASDSSVMNKDDIKEALIEAMKENVLQELLKAHVREAVAEAVAAKDDEIRELREELEDTKVRLNDLEQYSRRLCLNVTGVPEKSNEDTNEIVMDLAKMAGVDVAPRDIDASHRVGSPRQGKVRAIIVRFSHFTARQKLYNARRELRKPRQVGGSTVSAETAHGVFISDNLTRDNQLILYKARQLKKDQKLSAAWSDVGKVKVRVSQGGPTHVVRSVRDLTKLLSPETAEATPAASSEAPGRPQRAAKTKALAIQAQAKAGTK